MQRSKMVQAYLEILELQERDKDFEFLCELVERHLATFAFGNIGCRLGDELPLNFESLFNRLVVQRRGGYCFEQNGLLYEVLEELGFSPSLYLGRVIHDQDIHPGLTHRISMIEYEGLTYVIDVGFGANGPKIPVLFSEQESHDSDRIFRVAEREAGEYHMQVFKDGDFYSLYRFELSRYGPSDCELGHFYSHKHPDSTFVNHLIASRSVADERRSLRDRDYWILTEAGEEIQCINDPEQLRQILVEELAIQVTADESRRLYDELSS